MVLFYVIVLNVGLGIRTAIWLQTKVRESGLGLRPRLNVGLIFVTHSVVEVAYGKERKGSGLV